MEFKLSPLILFIILLVVLALSSMIKSYMNREGFITYNHGSALFSTKTVGIYSSENPITKIYDDIYYDPRNGNVVVVYTKSQYTNAASVDADGKNIKAIEIVPRKNVANNQVVKYENNTVDKIENGVSKAEVINQVTPESRKTTLDTTEVAWSYKSGSNQVNYFTWGSNTYIYVMDLTGLATSGNSFASDAQGNSFASKTSTTSGNSYSGTVKHASGAFYTGSINPNTSFDFTGADGDSNVDIYVTNSYPQQTNDGYDDKSMIEPVYHPSRTVYQITSTIKYDIANGNLLIVTPTTSPKKIEVYYRSGEDMREDDSTPNITLTTLADAQASGASYITQSFSKSVSKPFFVQDYANKNTVMYWPSGENTLIAVFENRDAAGTIPIKKTVRFTSSGVWTAPSTSSSSATPDASGNRPDISGGNYGDFWKWWSYFNSNAVGGVSNDYMLKTQIVPPVCPSCPACQGGACTNCGGQGGSGSMAQDGSSLAVKSSSVDGVNGPSSAIASVGKSAGQTITNTAAVAGLTAVGTGAIAADLAGKTIGTAGNIVGKTLDTAGNIVDKTFDTAGNIINTTGGLLQSAGSGVGNLLSSDPTRVGYDQSYRGPRAGSNNTGIYQPIGTQSMSTGQPSGSTIDPYTYNGALQSKGSNYRPITTDFSSFGR